MGFNEKLWADTRRNTDTAKSRAMNYKIIGFGDSITIGSTTQTAVEDGWLALSIYKSNKGKLIYNAGVAGNKTSDMLSRIQTDVIDKNPHICIILCGTNDIGAGGIANAVVNNIEIMVKDLLNNGIMPVLCTITPRNDAYNTEINKANILIQNLAMEYNLYIVDFHSVLVLPSTGYINMTYTSDGIHPNKAGDRLLADKVISDFFNKVSIYDIFKIDSNVSAINMLPNGLFLDDTNSDGIPNGWINSGGTAIPSLVNADAPILGKWFKITKENNSLQYYTCNTITTGFSVGDTINISGYFDAVAEVGGLLYQVKVSFVGTANSVRPIGNWTTNVTKGKFSYDYVIPADTTGIKIDLLTNTGTGVFQVAQLSVVNLTTLGIG